MGHEINWVPIDWIKSLELQGIGLDQKSFEVYWGISQTIINKSTNSKEDRNRGEMEQWKTGQIKSR